MRCNLSASDSAESSVTRRRGHGQVVHPTVHSRAGVRVGRGGGVVRSLATSAVATSCRGGFDVGEGGSGGVGVAGVGAGNATPKVAFDLPPAR
jgi:hypothetical protein